MNTEITERQRLTIASIDGALRKAIEAQAKNIVVDLTWQPYVDVLAVHGVTAGWDDVLRWGHDFSGRPLTKYRGYSLRMNNLYSAVWDWNDVAESRGWLV